MSKVFFNLVELAKQIWPKPNTWIWILALVIGLLLLDRYSQNRPIKEFEDYDMLVQFFMATGCNPKIDFAEDAVREDIRSLSSAARQTTQQVYDRLFVAAYEERQLKQRMGEFGEFCEDIRNSPQIWYKADNAFRKLLPPR